MRRCILNIVGPFEVVLGRRIVLKRDPAFDVEAAIRCVGLRAFGAVVPLYGLSVPSSLRRFVDGPDPLLMAVDLRTRVLLFTTDPKEFAGFMNERAPSVAEAGAFGTEASKIPVG
ncbi:MAG: hypothetical protein M1586_01810 [Patescibacteria group bacterium]|nr:hypothetical protein [Patescibacteria group bacterium]MCL5262018.1 hypothetical protein [Patescibacteria group bacterium]